MSGEDGKEKIDNGADLIQIYSGLEPETESLQNEDHSGYENAANPYEQRGLAGIAVKHYGTGRGEG